MQYPVSVKKWSLHCLTRAISSGDSQAVEEIMSTISAEPIALPEPHEIANGLLQALVVRNPEGPRNFLALWNAREVQILGILERISIALKSPTYVSDALGRLLWSVQKTIGIRETLRINATIRYVPPFILKEVQRRSLRVFLSPSKDLC
jgi:hypothetical protein